MDDQAKLSVSDRSNAFVVCEYVCLWKQLLLASGLCNVCVTSVTPCSRTRAIRVRHVRLLWSPFASSSRTNENGRERHHQAGRTRKSRVTHNKCAVVLDALPTRTAAIPAATVSSRSFASTFGRTITLTPSIL